MTQKRRKGVIGKIFQPRQKFTMEDVAKMYGVSERDICAIRVTFLEIGFVDERVAKELRKALEKIGRLSKLPERTIETFVKQAFSLIEKPIAKTLGIYVRNFCRLRKRKS